MPEPLGRVSLRQFLYCRKDGFFGLSCNFRKLLEAYCPAGSKKCCFDNLKHLKLTHKFHFQKKNKNILQSG